MPGSSDAELTSRDYDLLSVRVSRGALWATAISVCVKGLNFVTAIVLARLLAPDDFGQMAIAMAVIVFLQTVTQTGFAAALIQKQDKPEDFLNTAWSFDLLRSLVLALLLCLAAPSLASFLNEPIVAPILRVLSISCVVQGLRNVGVILFMKNIEYHKQFVLDIIPLFIQLTVTLVLAFNLRNVWALVWGTVANSVAFCAVSYLMHPFRPTLELDIGKARQLFSFSVWILGSSVLTTIREQGLSLFVGKTCGTALLGFLNRASTFSSMLLDELNVIVWKVGYPAYSQLGSSNIRFKRAYLKTLKLLTLVGLPIAGGLFVVSREFVLLFLTEKWLPIVPVIQILCVHKAVDMINTPAGIVFPSSGKPSISTKLSALTVLILCGLLYPLSSNWGIAGAAAALLISNLSTAPLMWFAASRITGCSAGEFIKPVVPPLVNTLIMANVLYTIKRGVTAEVTFLYFGGLVVIGVIVYALSVLLWERYFNYGMFVLIRERTVVLR